MQAIVIRLICIYSSMKIRYYGKMIPTSVVDFIHEINLYHLPALVEP